VGDPFLLALLGFGIAFVVALLWLRRPDGLFTGRARRLPAQLECTPIDDAQLPSDAEAPVQYLSDRLAGLGFRRAPSLYHLPRFDRQGRKLILMVHVHPDESAAFFMGIEGGLLLHSQLMLHVLTPLTEGRRVETTTLSALAGLDPPAESTVTVVQNADRIEELWSAHRRQLADFERRERVDIEPWLDHLNASYTGWLRAGVAARRLVVDPTERVYKVETPVA
jgi:hypothetical protein